MFFDEDACSSTPPSYGPGGTKDSTVDSRLYLTLTLTRPMRGCEPVDSLDSIKKGRKIWKGNNLSTQARFEREERFPSPHCSRGRRMVDSLGSIKKGWKDSERK
jgi:hypothetical protein